MRKISLQVSRTAVNLQSRTRKLSLQVAGKPSTSRGTAKPFPKFGTDFVIHVTTGDREGAGTDSNVHIRLYDGKGNQTEPIKLDRRLKNDLERGTTDSFPATGADGFGNIEKIELWRDNFGIRPDWYLETIVVEHRSRTRYVFPMLRWVSADRHYMVHQYDCVLPQEDSYPEERRLELEQRRRRLRKDQQKLADNYKESATEKQRKKQLARVSTLIPKWPQKPWGALYDMRKLFKQGLDEPMCASVWRDDCWFGMQRLEGVCCRLLRSCSKLPEKLAVDAGMLEPMLEGMPLTECLQHGRLFSVDLGLMHGLKDKNGHEVVAPIGLFFLNDVGDLMPLAIQLFQRPDDKNPVFLPTDKGHVWTVAKMFFNMAEAQYQYGFLYRGVCIEMLSYVAQCTEQRLSPSHPIYKLLAPHLIPLLSASHTASQVMDVWLERCTTMGAKGMQDIMMKGLSRYRLEKHANVVRELNSRGVSLREKLPRYGYRDSALPIFRLLHSYCTTVVAHYYNTADKIRQDHELQSWRIDVARQVGGVPGHAGQGFRSVEEIVDTVTSLVSICTVEHSALANGAYDQMGMILNYPLKLIRPPPSTKDGLSAEDVLSYLPDREVALEQLVSARVRSTPVQYGLAQYRTAYTYDPPALEALEELRENLRTLSGRLEARHRDTKLPYRSLDPQRVGNYPRVV